MARERASSTRRLLGVLRIALAILLLGWVGKNLPWEDKLIYRDESGQEVEAHGRIEGDWKYDPVRFFPSDPAAIDARWPLVAREPVSRGEPILAKRRGERDALGFDWEPGMPRLFGAMDVTRLALAQGLFVLAVMTIITRWWRLLALAGCPTSWGNALRLTFLGLFFNNVLPGATGGDVVKGLAVAHENKGRGAEALVTVLVDRVFGMIALALVALFVILVAPFVVREDGGLKSLVQLRASLLWGLAVCVMGVVLYASKTFRRRTGLSALVDRLPLSEKLRSLDRAALLYLKQPRPVAIAFLISFVNHVLVTLGVFVLGGALGVPRADVSLTDYFVLVPVANLISAVPLAPGGWGVGELAFQALFRMIGASPAMGVAVSVTFRLSQLAIGLLGGVFLLLPSSRSELREARKD